MLLPKAAHTSSSALRCTLLLCSLATGCQPAMSTSPVRSPEQIVQNSWPLKFSEHNFEAACYNTIGCKVVYAGVVEVEDAADVLAPPPPAGDYRARWGFASHVGIKNFPPPAQVAWRSKDGVPLYAEVDFAEILADGLVRHNVARADIPEDTIAMPSGPDLFLEVNDRSITVLMKATIALRDTPTQRGKVISELIPVWNRNF